MPSLSIPPELSRFRTSPAGLPVNKQNLPVFYCNSLRQPAVIPSNPLVSSFSNLGYIVMLRARMFRSLVPVLMIKERNIRARNITI